MQKLNLPEYSFEVKSSEKGAYILDGIRKKYVRLTPEEWVRQNFVMYLLREKGYPAGRIAIEKKLKGPGLVRRTDLVLYDRQGRPDILVECKAPSVPITQEVMDQAVRYNMELEGRIICLTNGLKHVYAVLDHENKKFAYLRKLPDYEIDIPSE